MTGERFDALVVGAGLAGLRTATLLAERGHDVLLVDRRNRLDAAIRTTGIFVRRTLDDFDLPPESLGPGIRRVVLYPPGLRAPVELISDRDEFRVGNMGPLYVSSARAARAAGVQVRLGARYLGRRGGRHVLEGAEGPYEVLPRYVVGADGARSAVARSLGLERNRHLLLGAEEVFPSSQPDAEPAFHCVLDPTLAPGYLAWVVDDGRHVHLGTAGYARRFPRGVRDAVVRFREHAPGLAAVPPASSASIEHRAGAIPVGGLLRVISSREGLLVGDASGAVSPLTAGGLDPCLRQAAQAAAVLDAALRGEGSSALARYDGAVLRERFRGRMLLRRGLSLVRSRALAELGFAVLRTPPGAAAARSILFADRSFPDAASGRIGARAATTGSGR